MAAYKCAIELPLKLVLGIDLKALNWDFLCVSVNTKPPRKCSPMPTWYLDILINYLNSDRLETLGS